MDCCVSRTVSLLVHSSSQVKEHYHHLQGYYCFHIVLDNYLGQVSGIHGRQLCTKDLFALKASQSATSLPKTDKPGDS